MLTIAQSAPDFALKDQAGNLFKLSELRNKSHVVIFFYPKDETPGCTAESCSFRDNYATFRAKNTEVIGISTDSIDSHKQFAQNHKLPFRLLSDEGGVVRKLFGVKKTFGILPPRATFVVDKNGIVCYAMSSQLNIQKHVDEALAVVQGLG